MGYFAIPGISGLDLFSGTVFVSTDSTIAQTVNGVVLGIVTHRESCRLSATYDLWLKGES